MNYIKRVIETYFGHDYPEETRRRFESWLTDESHAAEKESELSSQWELTDNSDSDDFSASFEKMRNSTGIGLRQRMRTMRRRLIGWQVAASVLVALLCTGAYFTYTASQSTPEMLQVAALTGDMQQVTLPDGTEVIINSQSTLLYPEKFEGPRRDVYLTGQAEFKVAKDPEHPFTVNTGDFDVTALGTDFTVSAYADDDEVSAYLIEGKVKVSFDNHTQYAILRPGELLAYNRATHSHSHSTPEQDVADAWTSGKLVFRSRTPKEIFNVLERHYPVSFVYDPGALVADRFTVRFDADTDIQEITKVLTQLMGFRKCSIEKGRCYFYN
ncbi:MAG: FecR domain-containing protein [Muribaculaceae bacterium]|nr:FecR domain-containing protein [Muribaculaceae bacterium]